MHSTLTAGPAEFVAAEAAGHVVTTSRFLDSALATGAYADLITIFSHPLLEFLAHCIVATDFFTMPRLLAAKADLSVASRTLQLFDLVILSAHMSLTTTFGAPTN